jgi:hypothetical protein
LETYIIWLSGLGSADHIVAALLVCEVSNQLRSQGRGRINRYRYAVEMKIVEGRSRPAKDDDNQIDELVIRRRRDGNSTDSVVTAMLRRLGGQHGSVPTHFRARCLEASQPGGTYLHVEYHFASVLASEIPYDLEEEVW